MEYYRESANQALEALQSRREGLSSEEAQQRQKQYGPNRLAEAKKDSVLVRFFKQMNDPMTLILIAAAILSGITAAYAHESFSDVIKDFASFFASHTSV